MFHTNSAKLERWLGTEQVAEISESMLDWYGPPIALAHVPGAVYACPGGDFKGGITAGYECSMYERGYEIMQRLRRGLRVTARNHAQGRVLHAGFASLAEIQTNARRGQVTRLFWRKDTIVGATAGMSVDCWGLGVYPLAGSAGSAAPGGRAPTNATIGAMPFTDPIGSDQAHFVRATAAPDRTNYTVMLYDRIFDVAKTMNSTTAEAVTGVPTRYQSTNMGDPDSIEGNFLFVAVGGTALAATAHNWTTCTYLDETNAASTLPSLVGNASATVRRLDHPVGQWFAPLETGDRGIKALTQMQCSALVATGLIDFVIGHPIAWIPGIGNSLNSGVAQLVTEVDAARTAFNLARIFPGACLTLMCPCKQEGSTIGSFGDADIVYG